MVNHSIATGTTLVLGGTGKTGRRIAQRLEARGVPTRAASRAGNPPFDWDDQGTWGAALDGVTAAYISYAPDLAIPGATDAVGAFVERAVAHGVRRLVLLSGRGEEEAQRAELLIQRAGRRMDRGSRQLVQPELLRRGVPGDGAGRRDRAPRGRGRGAVRRRRRHRRRRGRRAHRGRPRRPGLRGDRARAAHVRRGGARESPRATGRAIRYVQIPPEAFAAGVAEAGLPEDVAWLLGYLFGTVLDGRNAHLTDGVQRALGRAPRDFSEYARAVAATGVWDVTAPAREPLSTSGSVGLEAESSIR